MRIQVKGATFYNSTEYITQLGRVKDWLPITIRNRLSVSASFVWRCLNSHSIVDLTNPSSSNRTCGATAYGFPMFFTPRHAPFSSQLLSEPCIAHISYKTVDSGNDQGRFRDLWPCAASSDAYASALLRASSPDPMLCWNFDSAKTGSQKRGQILHSHTPL